MKEIGFFHLVRLFSACRLLEHPRVYLGTSGYSFWWVLGKHIFFFQLHNSVLPFNWSYSLSPPSMEDLSSNWSNFSLSERENTCFTLPWTQKSSSFVVAAKFLTSRFLVMDAVVRTFKQIWRSQNGFKIRNIGNHIVLFVFDNIQDVERILQNQPWTFDKHFVVLKRYEEGS